MTKSEIFRKTEEVLEDAKCGILATVSKDQKPVMRWMTPVFLDGERNLLYAVTSPNFHKAAQLKDNNNAQWMMQKKNLSEIINIQGKVNIIDNPSLKSEIIEKIGNRLFVFWKSNKDSTDFVVLETVVESITYFRPMDSEKNEVVIRKEP